MVLTENEKKILFEKWEHPERKVLCPRCGKELVYEQRGNSLFVGCKTPKCIFTGERGL